MTRVKICGVTNDADLDAVIAAGVDAVGVISDVTVDTPREVDRTTATELVDGVPPFVTTVLVTMPDDVASAVRRVDDVGPQVVQVHSSLSPSQVDALGRRIDAQVVAAVDAESGNVFAYADAADALLVDSADSDGGGGTGEIHDWQRTRDVVADLDVPVILAGGLTPDNVASAVDAVGPFAVDVASGVESTGGVKDHTAVEQFVVRAKRAKTEVSA